MSVYECPRCIFNGEEPSGPCADTRALLVLNNTLPPFFDALWHSCRLRVCADGGSNRVHDWSDVPASYAPCAVVGDLDSARPAVLDFFRSHGAVVRRVEDQDSTDFMKAVDYILEQRTPAGGAYTDVFVVGALGGNFSQEVTNLCMFWMYPQLRFTMVSEHNVVWLLREGTHTVVCPMQRMTCGLLPLGLPVEHVCTTGLRWNINSKMFIGGLVSSSNVMEGTSCTVEVRGPNAILFTLDVGKDKIPARTAHTDS
eukprot:m51a1_g14116 putative thiamin pyrophosphokinase 1 (255) ;mRNA; r:152739-153970